MKSESGDALPAARALQEACVDNHQSLIIRPRSNPYFGNLSSLRPCLRSPGLPCHSRGKHSLSGFLETSSSVFCRKKGKIMSLATTPSQHRGAGTILIPKPAAFPEALENEIEKVISNSQGKGCEDRQIPICMMLILPWLHGDGNEVDQNVINVTTHKQEQEQQWLTRVLITGTGKILVAGFELHRWLVVWYIYFLLIALHCISHNERENTILECNWKTLARKKNKMKDGDLVSDYSVSR